MNFALYQKKKEKLMQVFSSLQQISKSVELKKCIQEIKQDMQLLANEHFSLVVVGEFSRGKSTFVNAMLGRRILPASVNPTTAIISKIIYGNVPHYLLFYKDKKKKAKELSENEFMSLTAPKEVDKQDQSLLEKLLHRQKELDNIDYAEVQYPLDFCRNQVEVVDTPGTNDLNVGRIEITYRYLNYADAVVLLLAADQALSASEAEFLRERIVGNQIQDIFFVINRKDTLAGAEDEKRVLDFVESNLRERIEGLPDKLHIHLVSSKQALIWRRAEAGEALKPALLANKPDSFENTGFMDFEQDLANFLTGEKGRAKLEKYIRRAKLMLKQLQEAIDLQIDITLHSVDEIRTKARLLKPKFFQVKREAEEAVCMMQERLEAKEGEIANKCAIARQKICFYAVDAVDSYEGEMDADDIAYHVERAVTAVQKEFLNDLQNFELKLFQEENGKLQKRLAKIWQDIDEEYRNSFCLPMIVNKQENNDNLDIVLYSGQRSELDQKIGKGMIAFGIIGALAGGALLPALFVGLVGSWIAGFFDDEQQTDMRSRVKRQVQAHYENSLKNISSQMVNNYHKQIKEYCQRVSDDVKGRVDEMENQLQAVLRKKEQEEQSMEQERVRLENLRDLLKQQDKVLMSIID